MEGKVDNVQYNSQKARNLKAVSCKRNPPFDAVQVDDLLVRFGKRLRTYLLSTQYYCVGTRIWFDHRVSVGSTHGSLCSCMIDSMEQTVGPEFGRSAGG